MQAQPQYGAWIHEAHHSAKRDAPSGTALLLRDAMKAAGFNRPIDMSSTRAGTIPGTHTIGFDGPSDTIELTHTARDRRGFASGALVAARWIQGEPAGIRCRTCWSLNGIGRAWRARPRSWGDNAYAIHRRRHRIDHAVQQGRLPRRGRGQAAGAPADRRRRPLPLAVRHDRRSADAEPSRKAARRRARGRRSQRPRAGAGRCGRLRHARGDRAGARHGARRRRRPAVGHAVLQQADAGRPVSALQGDRREHRALPIVLYNVPTRTGVNMSVETTARLVGDSEHRRHQGSRDECRALVRDRLERARRTSSC